MKLIEQVEQDLLKEQINLDKLRLFERKSFSKLQLVLHKRHWVIRSIKDKFQVLRVVLFSLISKLYSKRTSRNKQLLNNLKRIVYKSSLSYLTKSKGINKKQLHRCVAYSFKKISDENMSLEQIMQSFNCIPFLDEILMTSIFEQKEQQKMSDNQIYKWVTRQFNMHIEWNLCNNQEQQDDQIYLKMLDDRIIRPTFKICQVYSSQIESPLKVQQISSTQYYELSNSIPSTNNNIQNIKPNQLKIKISKHQKNKNSTLWSILCCAENY